jgi:hypothetical protein
VRRLLLVLVLAGCGSSSASVVLDGATDAIAHGSPPAADRVPADAPPEAPADAGVVNDTVPAITAEQACQRYAQMACDQESRCSPSIFALTWSDEESCRRRTLQTCPRSFTAAGSNWTPTQLAACTDSMAKADCTGFLFGDHPACQTRPGNLPSGSPCLLDVQCEGLDCRQSGLAACGVCGQKGGEGEACGTVLDCQPHHSCIRKVCTPRRQTGAACDLTHWCDLGLSCFAGFCGKQRGPGEPCQVNEGQCALTPAWLECVAPAGAVMGTCQPARTAGTGEACGPVPDAPGGNVECRAGGRCTSFTEVGTCVAAVADGMPCDDRTPCLPGARCVGGKCGMVDPATCQ